MALGLRVFKHFFQGLHPHRNFALQLGQLGQYLRWRTVPMKTAWAPQDGSATSASDHGYNIGHHGIWHKGNASWLLTKNPPGTENIPEGKRPNVFDTSLRVPALVRWPGKIPAGRVVARTVTHIRPHRMMYAVLHVQIITPVKRTFPTQ